MLNPPVWIAIILALAVGFVLFKVVRGNQHKNGAVKLPDQPLMQPAEAQLSVVEQCCLQTLQQVAGAEYNIRNKVALSEFSDSATDNGRQLMDFVLFSKKNSKPACVIQLQSVSGNDESLMEKVLAKQNISLYRLPRKSSYSIIKMQERLKSHLETPPPSPDEMVATISMQAFRLCKKCQAQMELRRASGGPHKGMLFWVCEGYPECASVELYTE